MARDRQERGWRLTKASWRLVRRDPTLVPLGLLAAGCSVITMVAMIGFVAGLDGHGAGHGSRVLLVSLAGAFSTTFVLAFFCAALAHAASASFDGEPLTIREALGEARLGLGTIATWSLIAVGVTFLVELLNFSGGGTKPLATLLALLWAFFVTYAIALIAIAGAGTGEAIAESAAIARRRWVEQLSGAIAISLFTLLAAIVGVILCAVGASAVDSGNDALGALLLFIGIVELAFLIVLSFATTQTFIVALLRLDGEELSLAEIESPPPATPIGGSPVLRVSGIVAGLLVTAALVGALLPHNDRRDNDLGRYTPEHGYYYTTFAPGSEVPLPAGAPVLMEGRQIGEVLGSRIETSRVTVWFRADPALEETIEDNPKQISSIGGYYYLRVGPPGGNELVGPAV
jgi:hypothetical protein